MKISKTVPMGGKVLNRPFVFLSLLVLMAVVLLAIRFIYGLGAATNLNNGYPWGLWAILDIHITAAMGCGGYVLAVVIYVMNKGEYHTLIRPAIVGSTLAYTLANMSAFIDIGRWWNFYQIMLPWNMNFNSVMLEIAICMGLYMLVLWIELIPPVLERAGKLAMLKKFNRWLFVIISLGIVLPTMHQSGLGAVIVAAGSKISPLWQTPWISFLFLSSAIIMGFSVVIFEGAMTVMGFGRRLELHLYRRFAKILRWALGIYLLVRFGDLVYRDALGAIFETPLRTTTFIVENALFAIPLIILLHPRWRGNARLLGMAAASLLLAGAALRFNALIVGFNPPAGYVYFPSLIEVLISIGLLTLEAVGFLYIVKRFPILPPREKTVRPGSTPIGADVATS